MLARATETSAKLETGCSHWLYGWKIYLRDYAGNESRRDTPMRATYAEAKAFLWRELAYGDYEVAWLHMKTAQDT